MICAPFVQVEALFLRAQEAGVSVAIAQDSSSVQKVINPSFQTHWGGRLTVGAHLPQDEWVIAVSFLHYHARVTEEFKGAQFFPTWTHPALTANGGFVDEVRSRWRLHLGWLDLQLTRCWPLSPCVEVSPFVALRGAGIRFKSRIDSQGGTLFPDALDDLSMKNKFWGIGPLVGVESVWRVIGDFGLFARGSCSLLYGSTYLHQDETVTGSMQNRINLFDQFHQIRKIVEMSIGLTLSHCFGCVEWQGNVGWDLSLLFGANQAVHFCNAQMEGKLFGHQGDLILQGLTMSLGIAF